MSHYVDGSGAIAWTRYPVRWNEGVKMTRRRVELTSYNCGNITEAQYDAWVGHVIAHWDRVCGLDVTIEQRRFGEAGDDVFDAKSAADRLVMREAVEDLWARWCAGSEEEQFEAPAQTQR